MSLLGLILARGGSKRCPGKNARLLGGMPLIFWTILAGKSAGLDRVVVSSDDKTILDMARRCGAETVTRPAELAADAMSSYPPILHALEALGEPFEWLCLLQPTSPFRLGIDVAATIAVAHDMMRLGQPPAATSVEAGKTVPNGAVYVGRVDWLRERLASGCAAPFDDPLLGKYAMPADRSLDIDTEDDFALAEQIMERTAV